MQKHLVIVDTPTGDIISRKMKDWLKENPQVLPGTETHGLTSHQLRNMLRKAGWRMESTETEVHLISPSIPQPFADAHAAALDAEENLRSDEEPTDEQLSFELESQLRDFIVSNLGSIPVNARKLKLFLDANGRSGREYPTGVGFIDILAVDEYGAYYVFELKRAMTSDKAVGQILRYMGWVQMNLAEGKHVHGVVVAKSLSESLKYAVSATTNLSAFEYSISFRLNAAPLPEKT